MARFGLRATPCVTWDERSVPGFFWSDILIFRLLVCETAEKMGRHRYNVLALLFYRKAHVLDRAQWYVFFLRIDMPLMHPQFSPVAFEVFGWPVHWYGLTYLAAFMMFLMLGKYRARKMPLLGFKPLELDDILFYGVLGVVLGGRLGYVIFYKPDYYLANPQDILKVWQGGMSFHGGFLGVMAAMALYAHNTKRKFWEVVDFIVPLVPLGLASGRIGNFINGELWGRVSDKAYSWLMMFPQAQSADQDYLAKNPQALDSANLAKAFEQFGLLPRHPSQLYQFAGEGLLLFVILWIYARKIRPMMAVSAVFLVGYGVLRFLAEFAREPDDYLGLLTFNLSMGQLLSLPMIVAGLVLLALAYKRDRGGKR